MVVEVVKVVDVVEVVDVVLVVVVVVVVVVVGTVVVVVVVVGTVVVAAPQRWTAQRPPAVQLSSMQHHVWQPGFQAPAACAASA